ncbi:hypothetical protein [Tepidimicrobium xylanilyticum]|uniref:Uncharacterized protein n=1 Tax=Tepidimicrobium xylanilyticum TaxID=1123352 RepID=A0A1H3EJL9_9FIRM|nr:hypothetical protein [Tepidimicrobium xylanilyticum]GMG96242.1 hypothetical protein EN5CB1_10680 [Tepidimicrobium xylanilyticum]SDX78398.1 hypothetical protein SAMN05660923_02923 [Tepidimicrobium xylanilyticum]
MFTRAIRELYILRDKYRDDDATVEAIDNIIFELSTGISIVLDILTNYNKKTKKYMN